MKYLLDCNNIITDGSLVRDYRISSIVNHLHENFFLSKQIIRLLEKKPEHAYLPAIIAETKDKRVLLLGVFSSKAEAYENLGYILKNLQARTETSYIVNDGVVRSIDAFSTLSMQFDADFNNTIRPEDISIMEADTRVERYINNVGKGNLKRPNEKGKNFGRKQVKPQGSHSEQ